MEGNPSWDGFGPAEASRREAIGVAFHLVHTSWAACCRTFPVRLACGVGPCRGCRRRCDVVERWSVGTERVSDTNGEWCRVDRMVHTLMIAGSSGTDGLGGSSLGSAGASIDRSLTSAALKTTEGRGYSQIMSLKSKRIVKLTEFVESIRRRNLFSRIGLAAFGSHGPDCKRRRMVSSKKGYSGQEARDLPCSKLTVEAAGSMEWRTPR